jgi:hypothetical protein
MVQNIYYSSSGSNISSFILNPQTKEVYISSNSMKPVGSDTTYSGFFKGKIPDTNSAHWEWTPLYNDVGMFFLGPLISKWIDSYTDETGWHQGYYTFGWQFRKDDGTVDYAAIMEHIYTSLGSDYIEFRYGGKTDQEALALLDNAKLEELYRQYCYDTTGQYITNGNSKFVHDFLFRTDTDEPAVLKYDNQFELITNTIFTGDGSIWGFKGYSWDSPKYCKLIDANGKRDFVMPAPLADGRKVISIKPADPFVYYLADINATGAETGVQHIYRFRMTSPHTADDMFDYIISRNPNNIEVLSYSVGGDFLYFSGTQGVQILNAKIDTATGVYTELDFGYKVTSVLAY